MTYSVSLELDLLIAVLRKVADALGQRISDHQLQVLDDLVRPLKTDDTMSMDLCGPQTGRDRLVCLILYKDDAGVVDVTFTGSAEECKTIQKAVESFLDWPDLPSNG